MYNFDVQIWAEDGKYNYAVVQEFDDGREFEPIGYGTADTLEEATTLAGKEVSEFWKNV